MAIAERVNFSNDVFTSLLVPIGMAQNVCKAGSHGVLQQGAQLSSVSGHLPFLSFAWWCGQTTSEAGALVFNALVLVMEFLVLSLAGVALLSSTRRSYCEEPRVKEAQMPTVKKSLPHKCTSVGKTSFRTTLSRTSHPQTRHDQQFAGRPANHRQVLAAMFGQYPFESEPTIAPDGTVQKSNPWLDEFIEDMDNLLPN